MNSNQSGGSRPYSGSPPHARHHKQDSDAESELIDMNSNDSFASYDSFKESKEGESNGREEQDSKPGEEGDKKGAESPSPPPPPPPSAGVARSEPALTSPPYGHDLQFGPNLSLPSLAMSMLVNGGHHHHHRYLAEPADPGHPLPPAHHSYLAALQQQQQQLLFNSSLKLAMATDHPNSVSAFRKVK